MPCLAVTDRIKRSLAEPPLHPAVRLCPATILKQRTYQHNNLRAVIAVQLTAKAQGPFYSTRRIADERPTPPRGGQLPLRSRGRKGSQFSTRHSACRAAPQPGRRTPLRWRPLTPALPLPAEVAMALPPLGPPSAAAVCVYIGREEPERWGRRGRSRLRRPPALHPLRAVRGETRHEGKVRRGAAPRGAGARRAPTRAGRLCSAGVLRSPCGSGHRLRFSSLGPFRGRAGRQPSWLACRAAPGRDEVDRLVLNLVSWWRWMLGWGY